MDKIEELLTRGVQAIYPTREELERVLREGKKLTLYQGFDPTGNQLHIGHMVGLKKLRQWQELGHHVIFLIGDFTGMVGDPSGKTTARKILTHEEVLKNAEAYKEQAGKILNFTGKNAVEIKFNGEWLKKMSAIEFLQIARLLSVNQVIERDMFQQRQKQGEDIYMNEFLYPVMQAYDSVAMNVDLEVGGNDQMFNMMMGRKLMRHMLKKDKFVMTTPLLTDSEGRKIGKTEGNVIGLTAKPEDLFGKVMGLSDDVIITCFEYLTDIPLTEIQEIENILKSGANPVMYKKRLAFEIVKQLNDEEKAKFGQEYFERTVQQKEAPEDMKTLHFSKELTILDVLLDAHFATSKSEARRLLEQGGVEINGEKINDWAAVIGNIVKDNETVVQVGKRRFVKIKLK